MKKTELTVAPLFSSPSKKAFFLSLALCLGALVVSSTFSAGSLAHAESETAPGLGDYQSLFEQANQTLGQLPRQSDPNTPTPGLGAHVEAIQDKLKRDLGIQRQMRNDRALKAHYIQVLNQLTHVSFSFQKRDSNYTHDFVLHGPYPLEPTRIAIQKAEELIRVFNKSTAPVALILTDDLNTEAKIKAREDLYLSQQTAWVKKITNTQTFDIYQGMRQRLQTLGPEAPFEEELGPVVRHLELRIKTNALVNRLCAENEYLAGFRNLALAQLQRVINPSSGGAFPYLPSIEAIQRAMEFFDVLNRAHDPTRSPKLYHSDRYDYYGHYLKAQIPDHIILPTLVSLGATDILKTRGVPIGFIGVNTEPTWVDGFWQTPYEFWVHDINHSRRMFQFFKEKAEELGMTIEQFAKYSDDFVKTRLMPLIRIPKSDDFSTANMKRLLKVLLFEILHEDALAATPDVMKTAVLRPPNLITPFERIDGSVVSYVMEPGATTLAYVFRKLAHDFYDMPGARQDNIVHPDFRTRPNIVSVAQRLFKELGFQVKQEVLEYFVSTDQGFPKDFKQTVADDINSRPGETVPLDQEMAAGKDHARELVASIFHEAWQKNSGYRERWKLAQAAFKDGRGVNDDFVISTQEDLQAYFKEREIPEELQKYFSFRTHPKTGRMMLYEDIRHLPHRYLAPNNQFENIQGGSLAVDIIEGIAENRLHFRKVEEVIVWLRAANQRMNLAWLRRNGHWAKEDPEYNRHWRDLSAGKQQNGMNLLRVALEIVTQLDPLAINGSQKSLIQEGIRRLELEIQEKRDQEVRILVTGSRLHENWQKNSRYTERWKPFTAKFDDGTPLTQEAQLRRYLLEKGVPEKFHPFYSFRSEKRGSPKTLQVDIRNVPYLYLPLLHREENAKAAALAVEIIDRIWSRQVSFKNVHDAERWIKAAAQLVHQGVLERNANGARDNPVYNQHWSKLPAINQKNDFDHVKIAFEARLRVSPGGMPDEQLSLIHEALGKLEKELLAKKCEQDLAI